MKFDRLERRDVERVFGARGLEMAKTLEYELTECNSVTLGDPPLYLLSMTLTPEAGCFERIHEVGHWYHCKLWPTISHEAPTYRTEACAIIAELGLMLYKNSGILQNMIDERRRGWEALKQGSEIIAMAFALVQLSREEGDLSIHERMGKIVNGEFG